MVHASRTLFLKEAVIGFGFLSGIWTHLGFDPETFVREILESLLVNADPGHAVWIKLLFRYVPLALTLLALILIYRRAGFWGYVATGIAYLAGLWFTLLSIPLLLVALLIGYFAARKSR